MKLRVLCESPAIFGMVLEHLRQKGWALLHMYDPIEDPRDARYVALPSKGNRYKIYGSVSYGPKYAINLISILASPWRSDQDLSIPGTDPAILDKAAQFFEDIKNSNVGYAHRSPPFGVDK